jgi:hypothetical protein
MFLTLCAFYLSMHKPPFLISQSYLKLMIHAWGKTVEIAQGERGEWQRVSQTLLYTCCIAFFILCMSNVTHHNLPNPPYTGSFFMEGTASSSTLILYVYMHR